MDNILRTRYKTLNAESLKIINSSFTSTDFAFLAYSMLKKDERLKNNEIHCVQSTIKFKNIARINKCVDFKFRKGVLNYENTRVLLIEHVVNLDIEDKIENIIKEIVKQDISKKEKYDKYMIGFFNTITYSWDFAFVQLEKEHQSLQCALFELSIRFYNPNLMVRELENNIGTLKSFDYKANLIIDGVFANYKAAFSKFCLA